MEYVKINLNSLIKKNIITGFVEIKYNTTKEKEN